MLVCFFFSSRRRHTRYWRDWSSDVCSSDLAVHRLLGRVGDAAARDGEPEARQQLLRLVLVDVHSVSAPQRRSARSEEHTSELQSRQYLVCRLLLEKKKSTNTESIADIDSLI